MGRFVLVLMAALGFFSASAAAGERIAVDEGNAPFMYGVEDRAMGIYPAVVREAFRRLGTDAAIEPLPWKRALSSLDAGALGIAGIYKTAERLAKYDYSEKIFDETIVVYVRAPTGITGVEDFAGIESLHGKTVGVLRGWSYGHDFDAAVKAGAIKTEEAGGDGANFNKLVTKRIDALLTVKETGLLLAAIGDYSSKVMALPTPLLMSSSYLAFAKSQSKTALLEKFNTALAAMRKDGSFDHIVAASIFIK